MSKPITSVAALTLVEQGRIALVDPILRWIPEIRHLVAADPVSDLVLIYLIQHRVLVSANSGATIATGRSATGRRALPVSSLPSMPRCSGGSRARTRDTHRSAWPAPAAAPWPAITSICPKRSDGEAREPLGPNSPGAFTFCRICGLSYAGPSLSARVYSAQCPSKLCRDTRMHASTKVED